METYACSGDAVRSPALRYVPALDGVRAISIMLVLLSHLGLREIIPGGFGVTVFFFISGLLITRQLLREQARTGSINLSAFFMRRLLRLGPALAVMTMVAGAAFVSLGGRIVPAQAAGLLYGVNWELIAGGLPSGLPDDYHPFSILWSLAIEEQFYLLLPLLVLLAGRCRRFDLVLLGLIAALVLWRAHVAASCLAGQALCLGAPVADRITYGTDTRLDGFLYGGLLAVVLPLPGGQRVLRSPAAIGGAAVLLVTSFVIRDAWFRLDAMLVVQGFGLALGVGWLLTGAPDGRMHRLLAWRPVVLVGQWSYSLYLWHWAVMVCAAAALPGGLAALTGEGRPGFPLPVFLPALLAASFALACLSYYFVERPTQRLRHRFGALAPGSGAAAARSGGLAPYGICQRPENTVDMALLGDQRG